MLIWALISQLIHTSSSMLVCLLENMLRFPVSFSTRYLDTTSPALGQSGRLRDLDAAYTDEIACPRRSPCPVVHHASAFSTPKPLLSISYNSLRP